MRRKGLAIAYLKEVLTEAKNRQIRVFCMLQVQESQPMKNLVLQRLTNLMYTDGEIEMENNVLKLVKQETKFDKILKKCSFHFVFGVS